MTWRLFEKVRKLFPPLRSSRHRGLLLLAATLFSLPTSFAFAQGPSAVPDIFNTVSTPADAIRRLSFFVLVITGLIFVVVFSLLVYAVIRFRHHSTGDDREPPQVYGSNQMELAWTVVPVLIVLVLFFATARVIQSVQDAIPPANTLNVTAIGHQFWWEFRYPALGIVTANELHVPVSDRAHPTPTFVKLLSADTDHSFWVPQLAGKTDLIPNRINSIWIDPHATGMYLGQCAQYCGTQHAKMLLRVYVDSPEQFGAWVAAQKQSAHAPDSVAAGRQIFETTACINCHAVSGTVANGRFGPDLTHLMSRDTIASGAASNTHENLKLWIHDPEAIKPGSFMPAMNLSAHDLEAVTAYLESLK
ncbi:MAG TPA: cytochrome c oxidase subunit II [Candidatus Acidoferrum sp.]|nr:cytochrome c oxidase subunit II [Candidatus Acidoferrum sp.]